jgi:hypothetical protein
MTSARSIAARLMRDELTVDEADAEITRRANLEALQRGIAKMRGLLPVTNAQQAEKRYAIRSWECADCLAWAEALDRARIGSIEMMGSVGLASPSAAITPANIELDVRSFCNPCAVERANIVCAGAEWNLPANEVAAAIRPSEVVRMALEKMGL